MTSLLQNYIAIPKWSHKYKNSVSFISNYSISIFLTIIMDFKLLFTNGSFISITNNKLL